LGQNKREEEVPHPRSEPNKGSIAEEQTPFSLEELKIWKGTAGPPIKNPKKCVTGLFKKILKGLFEPNVGLTVPKSSEKAARVRTAYDSMGALGRGQI